MRYLKKRLRLGCAILAFLGLVLAFSQPWSERSLSVFTRMDEQTLIIDPGHGGEDGGAVAADGATESQINLAIALKLDQLMGFYGVRTCLTREEDVSIHDVSAKTLREKKVSDLHNRVDLINGIEDATLISIHQNSFPEKRYHGTQVFYGDQVTGGPLARAIQESIRAQLDPENKRKPQQVASSVYLMNHISCRAVLVECGFLSNPTEAGMLQERAYQTKLAMVLAAAYLTVGSTQEGESLV